jgi:uncharacterized protein (TIGR02594 family)
MIPYEVAKAEIGVKEVRGGECARILEYHDCTTLDACEDETPWCSAFANWCCKEAGLQGTGSAAARSWLKWGEALEKPVEGCIVVLRRQPNPASGHVGFFVRQLGDMIEVLGGNQGDCVKRSWFHAGDVLGYRVATR